MLVTVTLEGVKGEASQKQLAQRIVEQLSVFPLTTRVEFV